MFSSAIHYHQPDPSSLVVYDPPYWSHGLVHAFVAVLLVAFYFLVVFQKQEDPRAALISRKMAALFGGLFILLPALVFSGIALNAFCSSTVFRFSKTARSLSVDHRTLAVFHSQKQFPLDAVLGSMLIRGNSIRGRDARCIGIYMNDGTYIFSGYASDRTGYREAVRAINDFLGVPASDTESKTSKRRLT